MYVPSVEGRVAMPQRKRAVLRQAWQVGIGGGSVPAKAGSAAGRG